MNNRITEKIFLHIKKITALLLWELGAIKVDIENPFKLVSGNYSPIYINCRKVISDPNFMRLFTAFSSFIIKGNEIEIDMVAGGETAGIPFATYVAESQSLPLVYVRKKTKDHGIASLVEGNIQKSSRVILVEDLITDGGSKINFIDAIIAVGGIIKETLVLFDRHQGGGEVLSAKGVQLYSVTDIDTALNVAENNSLVDKNTIRSVKEYLNDEKKWHISRDLKYHE